MGLCKQQQWCDMGRRGGCLCQLAYGTRMVGQKVSADMQSQPDLAQHEQDRKQPCQPAASWYAA